MKLSQKVRAEFDGLNNVCNQYSFYHYFPLALAISESTTPLRLEPPLVWVGEEGCYEELYYLPPSGHVPDYRSQVKKVWIALKLPPRPKIIDWNAELYDANFIYDLETTLAVKNFRDNVKKFQKNESFSYCSACLGEAKKIVENWYLKRKGSFEDFGYTIWLTENYSLFPDLRARVVKMNGEPVAFSLWGKLNENTGIHLICKDRGIPYLQDYTRYMTYDEMREAGLRYANDGGDAGQEGIRIYKLKLRPKFIVPIYSWVRG